jgi:circadian clock protein KaiC
MKRTPEIAPAAPGPTLSKSPSGIQGLDEITYGGLPQGRPTLICGGAGSGKTLMAAEFIVRGATDYGEPGVFMAFEETPEDLAANVRSLGFDLERLVDEGRISVDHVHIERSEIEETGEYDLEGLFIRLGHAIDTIGAQRVVLDTLESLFSGFTNEAILRAELRRLFRWLKDKGVTAMITAERGDGALTRQGLEEYVSDCVIVLDHRITDQIATRRLRIAKYRGSSHGTNEYPFVIDEGGVNVLPITSVALDHTVGTERTSSGLPALDEMLGGQGYYRGSSVLVSGTAGTGKSTLAATFVDAACRDGKKALYFAFEESPSQIVRNMRSVGIDLQPWVDQKLLRFHAARPTLQGLESHLAIMFNMIDKVQPDVLVVDPISNFIAVGNVEEIKSMLMRLVDSLKTRNITALFTALVHGMGAIEQTDVGVSSIIDTWLLLRDVEFHGERNRVMYVLKSRGMSHSNQMREFLITDQGLDLVPAYLGPEGALTGSARVAQEARESAAAAQRSQDIARKRRELDRKRRTMEAEIAALRASLGAEEEELARAIEEATRREQQVLADRAAMAASRKATAEASTPGETDERRERNRG